MLEAVNQLPATGAAAPEVPHVAQWDASTYSTKRHGASITDCDCYTYFD